jgi:hypothetical protein
MIVALGYIAHHRRMKVTPNGACLQENESVCHSLARVPGRLTVHFVEFSATPPSSAQLAGV